VSRFGDRANDADLARTLIHEYAHALLHFDVDDDTERSKREVEAEAVAYVVGRYCGLDTSGSAFYLAAWGVGRSRGCSRAAWTDQYVGAGSHRHTRSERVTLNQRSSP